MNNTHQINLAPPWFPPPLTTPILPLPTTRVLIIHMSRGIILLEAHPAALPNRMDTLTRTNMSSTILS